MNNPVWKFFTSLRLTVVLLTLGLLLVFFGTVAQVHEGLWNAQERWFRSILVTRAPEDPWWFPPVFPGGYTIGVLLLLNLIAAHIKRFQWSSKKIGINLTHFGIILLLVGQLVTDLFSRESHLSFKEGETKNYSEAHRANELIFATDAGNGQDKVVSMPESLIRQKGDINDSQLPFTVRVKEYGVNGEVFSKAEVEEASGRLTTAVATVQSQYGSADMIVPQAERALESAGRVQVWRTALGVVGETDTNDVVAAAKRVAADPNREGKLRDELKARFQAEMLQGFSQRGGAMKVAAEQFAKKGTASPVPEIAPASTQGAGLTYSVIPLPEAKDMDRRNLPYAIIEVVPKNGQSLGTWLVSPFLGDQEIKVGDTTYRTAFRFERYYHPFSVTLLKTTHEVYRGTITAANPQGIPKNFQSRVRINNPQTGEAREVDIYMNNPLRYAGLTFYQYQMGRDEKREIGTSTLQVVRNPGWLTPYFGCLVVGLGMTWQFMYHLIGFMKKRNAPEPAAAKNRGGKRSGKREAATHAA
jgi:hypothetical protein